MWEWPKIFLQMPEERLAVLVCLLFIGFLTGVIWVLWHRLKEKDSRMETMMDQQRDLVRSISDAIGRNR